ncbi:hypothetical protein SNE25_25265 [Mucilaginibacter sabulilitoris]|uniref:Uncharacterized protein n=1 Tax=Mucilaginibacter sabulilitoris TaxID=1173583 RepID=A0ABZ0THY2_9SPHI|nr:hypothetical protein [Mucilaginibacter sabulilitoris]WPU92638.1 hypothetical protein SNE25_25265 [Mucilaginibacter sabulilitoris]
MLNIFILVGQVIVYWFKVPAGSDKNMEYKTHRQHDRAVCLFRKLKGKYDVAGRFELP